MAAGGTIFFPEKCPKQYFRKKHGFNNGYEAHIKANKKHGAEPLLRKKNLTLLRVIRPPYLRFIWNKTHFLMF
jgi:hypothetical protein